MPTTPFEIPDHVREAADKSVAEAKKAFNDFIDATHKAVANAEASARTLGEGAADVNRGPAALPWVTAEKRAALSVQFFPLRLGEEFLVGIFGRAL